MGIYGFRALEATSVNQDVGMAMLFLKPEDNPPLLLSSFWVFASKLGVWGLQLHDSSLCPHCYIVPMCLCSRGLLVRILVILDWETYSPQHGLSYFSTVIITNHSCSDLISKQSHILRHQRFGVSTQFYSGDTDNKGPHTYKIHIQTIDKNSYIKAT